MGERAPELSLLKMGERAMYTLLATMPDGRTRFVVVPAGHEAAVDALLLGDAEAAGSLRKLVLRELELHFEPTPRSWGVYRDDEPLTGWEWDEAVGDDASREGRPADGACWICNAPATAQFNTASRRPDPETGDPIADYYLVCTKEGPNRIQGGFFAGPIGHVTKRVPGHLSWLIADGDAGFER